ncbi:MAG: hypothetical protein JXQ75_21365, partial [Phycisphaerae bacterium]|nr:hypothetical protein [Phycisphaerae bacterium]
CGTGVSPVVFTVRNGVSEPLFSLSPRAGRAHHATPPSNQEAQDPMVRAADPAWMAYPPTIHNGPEQARENIIAAARLRNSYLGRIGHAIEPAIKPLGYDWRIGIGLLSSFLAREVFVGTMGITFAIGEVDEESEALRDRLAAATWPDGRPVLTPLVGVGLMVFYVLACQCVSTVAVVRRETNSWRWPALMFTYMTILAYVSALLVHQIGIQLGLGAY